MKSAILTLTLVLTVGNLVHCQDWENLLFRKMEEVLEKQGAALSQLKEMQEKQGYVVDKLQEMQEKQGHVEDKLKELESSLHQEISGIISLLESAGKDECSEGSHNCGNYEACTDKFINFTCACKTGFTRNGLHCEDIDECAQGKAECSPQATCRNSIGSYSCSCNPPFEGDGRNCDFSCESPAKVIEGLGCIQLVREGKTWQEMKATCQGAGGCLLQYFQSGQLRDVVRTFDGGRWIGVYEGKWLESRIPVEEELWGAGPRTESSRPCGGIGWDSSSSSYRVYQYDCSPKLWGYCQFIL